MERRPNALHFLLRRRHWQPHRTFIAEYDRAAAAVDERLVGRGPSRVQLHRWQSGHLAGLPYPDHCRVLEAMFPGWTAAELFVPASLEQVAERDHNIAKTEPRWAVPIGPSEVSAAAGAADDRFCDVTAVYATRGEFMSAVPPTALFDGATRIRAVGLSLNLICQHYPDQSLCALVEGGAKLECLFLDPAGEAIKAREREEDTSLDGCRS